MKILTANDHRISFCRGTANGDRHQKKTYFPALANDAKIPVARSRDGQRKRNDSPRCRRFENRKIWTQNRSYQNLSFPSCYLLLENNETSAMMSKRETLDRAPRPATRKTISRRFQDFVASGTIWINYPTLDVYLAVPAHKGVTNPLLSLTLYTLGQPQLILSSWSCEWARPRENRDPTYYWSWIKNESLGVRGRSPREIFENSAVLCKQIFSHLRKALSYSTSGSFWESVYNDRSLVEQRISSRSWWSTSSNYYCCNQYRKLSIKDCSQYRKRAGRPLSNVQLRSTFVQKCIL